MQITFNEEKVEYQKWWRHQEDEGDTLVKGISTFFIVVSMVILSFYILPIIFS